MENMKLKMAKETYRASINTSLTAAKDDTITVQSSDLVKVDVFRTRFTLDKDSRGRIYTIPTKHKLQGKMFHKSLEATRLPLRAIGDSLHVS